MTKWTYDACREEAKKYTRRVDFQRGCMTAYHVCLKNGWLDEFAWIEKPRRWCRESCREEAKIYTMQSDFQRACRSAYAMAKKNGWLAEYHWLGHARAESGHWTSDSCREESKKYKSRYEFSCGSSGAYKVARVNGWLKEYTWLSPSRTAKKWDHDACREEAGRYGKRTHFQKGNPSAYHAAIRNGWLDEFFGK